MITIIGEIQGQHQSVGIDMKLLLDILQESLVDIQLDRDVTLTFKVECVQIMRRHRAPGAYAFAFDTAGMRNCIEIAIFYNDAMGRRGILFIPDDELMGKVLCQLSNRLFTAWMLGRERGLKPTQPNPGLANGRRCTKHRRIPMDPSERELREIQRQLDTAGDQFAYILAQRYQSGHITRYHDIYLAYVTLFPSLSAILLLHMLEQYGYIDLPPVQSVEVLDLKEPFRRCLLTDHCLDQASAYATKTNIARKRDWFTKRGELERPLADAQNRKEALLRLLEEQEVIIRTRQERLVNFDLHPPKFIPSI